MVSDWEEDLLIKPKPIRAKTDASIFHTTRRSWSGPPRRPCRIRTCFSRPDNWLPLISRSSPPAAEAVAVLENGLRNEFLVLVRLLFLLRMFHGNALVVPVCAEWTPSRVGKAL